MKALNYKEPFDDHSAPLINKLLNDLLKASEAYQVQKKQLELVSKNKMESQIDLSVNDLKKVNVLLEKENNEVHSRLIKQEQLIASLEVQVKKLEIEKEEMQRILKFQNGGKEVLDENTVDNKSLSAKINKEMEKQNLALREEVNRLRLKYENEFSSSSVQLTKVALFNEEMKQKEQFYLNQIDFLQKKGEKQEKEIESFQKSKIPELNESNKKLKRQLESAEN